MEIILLKFWILEFLEISTLLHHSVTIDNRADSTLIILANKRKYSFSSMLWWPFCMSRLRTWEKMVQPQSASLSFVLTAKYEFENKFSISVWYLTTKCVPVCPQCKIFYVGNEYRSKGRNISTNWQILAGILSRFISPKYVLLVTSEWIKTNLFCDQNDGKKNLIIFK